MSTFPTNAALEAAIIAHADEDTPRLVYADWLDEHGDPDRAAFIRVQCRLAGMPPDDPEWIELDVQQDEIIRRLAERISSLRQKVPSPPFYSKHSPPRVAFQRGFPHLVVHQDDNPSTEVKEQATAIAWLVENTTHRAIDFNQISPALFSQLVESPSFAQLQELSFAFKWIAQYETSLATAYMKLVEAPVAQRLQRLDLRYCPDSILRSLSETTGFPAIRQLKLSSGWNRTSELRSLMAATWLRALRHLHFSAGNGEDAEMVLSAAGQMPELHTLEFRSPETDLSHLAAGAFPRLSRLACPDMRMMLRGLQQLLNTSWFARLRVLDLTSNELGDRAIFALAAHPVARNLRDLRLGNNSLGQKGLLALAEAGAFPELVRLDLSLTNDKKRKATEADLTAFLSRLTCPRLRSLNLKQLPLGDNGAKAIATNPALSELRELQLGKGITEHGMNALRSVKHLQQTLIV